MVGMGEHRNLSSFGCPGLQVSKPRTRLPRLRALSAGRRRTDLARDSDYYRPSYQRMSPGDGGGGRGDPKPQATRRRAFRTAKAVETQGRRWWKGGSDRHPNVGARNRPSGRGVRGPSMPRGCATSNLAKGTTKCAVAQITRSFRSMAIGILKEIRLPSVPVSEGFSHMCADDPKKASLVGLRISDEARQPDFLLHKHL